MNFQKVIHVNQHFERARYAGSLGHIMTECQGVILITLSVFNRNDKSTQLHGSHTQNQLCDWAHSSSQTQASLLQKDENNKVPLK